MFLKYPTGFVFEKGLTNAGGSQSQEISVCMITSQKVIKLPSSPFIGVMTYPAIRTLALTYFSRHDGTRGWSTDRVATITLPSSRGSHVVLMTKSRAVVGQIAL